MSDECKALKLAGYDSCIIGISDVWDTSGCVEERFIYNGDDIVHKLVMDDGMDIEEAHEFIAFNIQGAYVGPNTPIIVWPVPDFIAEGEE